MEVYLLDGEQVCAKDFEGLVRKGCLSKKGCGRRGGFVWKADVFAAFFEFLPPLPKCQSFAIGLLFLSPHRAVRDKRAPR